MYTHLDKRVFSPGLLFPNCSHCYLHEEPPRMPRPRCIHRSCDACLCTMANSCLSSTSSDRELSSPFSNKLRQAVGLYRRIIKPFQNAEILSNARKFFEFLHCFDRFSILRKILDPIKILKRGFKYFKMYVNTYTLLDWTRIRSMYRACIVCTYEMVPTHEVARTDTCTHAKPF